MNKWKDPNLTLGERCVAFAENEMKNGVKEDKKNSFTSPRIREYLAICRRRGSERFLNLTAGNWCSAGVSFCLKHSLLTGEEAPHGYRAGVIEIENDMKAKKTWRPVDLARKKIFIPQKGDVVIFDRSNPKIPSSSWWRHIGFYYDGDHKGNFRLISGNNGGKWKIDNHNFNSPKLLGFGEYPDKIPRFPSIDVQEQPLDYYFHNLDDLELVPMIDTGAQPIISQIANVLKKYY